MPWVVNGGERERGAADYIKAISTVDTALAALMLGFPWIMDGITPVELSAIARVHNIWREGPEFARAVLNLRWAQDDMPLVKLYALTDLRDLGRSNPALAWQVIQAPFMDPPFRLRDEYALRVLQTLSWEPPGSTQGAELLSQLRTQQWFSDGLDDLDAVLLYAIANSSVDYRQALLQAHHVRSVEVQFPLTGKTDITVVRHTPFPQDDHTLAALEDGVRAIEGFMGRRFPVDDVVLIVTEPDIWNIRSTGKHVGNRSGGRFEEPYLRAHMLAKNSESGPDRDTLYHELGHYYILNGHQWLVEGTAELMQAYTRHQLGTESIEQRIDELEKGGCSKENIQQHIDDGGDDHCNYHLGERFMLAMYQGLGLDAVSAALGELYDLSQRFEYLDEDVIYQAFLSNAPPGKEETFKTAYRQYHGGPVVDASLEDNPDWSALTALYDATNGAGWIDNRSWTSATPLGAWYGVATESGGRVRVLDLDGNQLAGQLPGEMGNLSDLRTLGMADNQLTGPIPHTLGNLSELVSIRLGRNLLTGQIPPALGVLTKLQALYLWENQLTGEIPQALAGMTGMRLLNLAVNQLTGPIPAELGRLSNLESLNLGSNQLSGEIPSELGNLSNLTWLALEKNQLSGQIPSQLGNLSSLELLRLWENDLTGSIPSELANLPNLGSLELNNNQLTGEIPAALGGLTKLRVLRLHRNQLSGEMPTELGNLSKLWSLNLSDNQLTGEIPQDLASLSDLHELYLAGNRFTGCIPDGLRNVPMNDLSQLGLPFCAASP